MDKNLPNAGCPACGSQNVACSVGARTFDVPFVGLQIIQIYVDHCPKCGEEGDFFDRNDDLIVAGLHRASQRFINQTVQWMVEKDISFPYLERVLSLPSGSVNRWLRGDFSRDVIALLRYVRTYPWLLLVADEKFNPAISDKILREVARKRVESDVGLLADSIRKGESGAHWRDAEAEFPEIRRPILMKGDSGYVAPP